MRLLFWVGVNSQKRGIGCCLFLVSKSTPKLTQNPRKTLPKPSPNPPKSTPNRSKRPLRAHRGPVLYKSSPSNTPNMAKKRQKRSQTGPNPPQVEPKTLPKSLFGAFFWPLCYQPLFAAISWPTLRHFSHFCWSPCLSVCASRHSFNGSGACFCKVDIFDKNAKKL